MKKSTILSLSLGLALAPAALAQTPEATSGPVAVQPQEQTAVIAQIAQLYSQTQADIETILQEVKDKASADAAAAKLKGLRKGFLIIKDELENDLAPESYAIVQELINQIPTKGMDDLVAALAQQSPPFFGSKDLVEALGIPQTPVIEDTSDQAFTPQQLQVVGAIIKRYTEVAGLAAETVRTIKDKESANAAAPKLKEYLAMMDAACDTLEDWAAGENITELVSDLVGTKYADAFTTVQELEDAINELADLEVPFYGSNDLAQVIYGDAEPEEEAPVAVERPVIDAEEGDKLNAEEGAFLDSNVEDILRDMLLLKETLATIKDKGTADAAALSVQTLLEEMAETSRKVEEWAATKSGQSVDVDAYIHERYAQGFALATEITNMLNALEAVDFLGSEALAMAITGDAGVKQAPAAEDAVPVRPERAELSEEVKEFANAFVQECTVYAEEAIAILRSIKDKETADAAAPRLKAIIEGLEASAGQFFGIINQLDDPFAIMDYVMPQLEGKINELETILENLSGQDVPFYGSNDLESVLKPTAGE